MSEHWEFALSHAKGNWVTIIGDDDGLLPNAVKYLFQIVSKNRFKYADHNLRNIYDATHWFSVNVS